MYKDYKDIWISKKVKQKTFLISTPFLVGIELQMHTGGRMCYGMLAAQVKPHDEQDLVEVSLAFTHQNIIKYENSFLLDDRFVYKGLPQEYVEQVRKSIFNTINEKEIYPQCNIIFEYAANCEVGSSPMLFGVIAEMIINMIYSSSIEEICSMGVESFTEKYVKNINLFL